MIKIAIVDDETAAFEELRSLLERYAEENGLNFQIIQYSSAEDFINGFTKAIDMVFMDIQMPRMDGMEAAKRLREISKDVLLIFVTNLAQMAAHGYEVQAFDFVIKPLQYSSLVLHINRAIHYLEQRQQKMVIITNGSDKRCIAVGDIYYVEVQNHTLLYHTAQGVLTRRGTMGDAQKLLAGTSFSLCNSCYYVNLRHVEAIREYQVIVHGTSLQISHPKRKPFVEALNQYIGG